MTAHPFPPLPAALILAATLGLSACATTGTNGASAKLEPVTPTTQFPLTAQNSVQSINLRVEPGLSPNQRRALDQVAAHASWTSGEPVNIEIVTSGDPAAISAGRDVMQYLVGHDVAAENLVARSAPDQPGDVVTVNTIAFTAVVYGCGKNFNDLSATGNNKVSDNFGCAVNSNLAAQIADPRDLVHPAAPTATDAIRKSIILDHYSKGEITTTAASDDAKGTISDAIK